MPAHKVFLDTGGWLALLNASDALHADANALWLSLGKQNYHIYLTDWIVAETGNGLARTRGRTHFVQAARRVATSPHATLVDVDATLLNRGLDLYHARPDKTWGLVDCVSFCVMNDNEIVEAFTNDRHFEQAGFQCIVPRP